MDHVAAGRQRRRSASAPLSSLSSRKAPVWSGLLPIDPPEQPAGDRRHVAAEAGAERQRRLPGRDRGRDLRRRRRRRRGRRQRLQRRGRSAARSGRRGWRGARRRQAGRGRRNRHVPGRAGRGRTIEKLRSCGTGGAQAATTRSQRRTGPCGPSWSPPTSWSAFLPEITANSSRMARFVTRQAPCARRSTPGRSCPTPSNSSPPGARSSRSSSPARPRSPAEIDTLLTVASRVPDHGKLTPWRFIVFEGEARRAAGEAIAAAFRAKYPDAKPEQVESERERLARAPLVIAVVSRAAPAREDPGMGAGALGRRRRHEPRARRACARLSARAGSPNGTPMTAACSMRSASRRTRRIAGFVHIGRPPGPPEDRPRPPLDEIVDPLRRR